MKMIRYYLLAIAFMFSVVVKAQQQPFYDEIQNFKKQDSLNPPPQNAILFVGSSSFRKWTDVQSYFPAYTIINRGFGGSTLPDVIRYANDIILPYHLKEIIIYCGENDFAASDNTSAEIVFERFKTLYAIIRSKMADVKIVFVSIKPSPSRRKYWSKMIDANKMIKDFISTQQHADFVDVYQPMLNSDGQPKPEIFESDSLHMNAKGYAIWQKVIEPYLMK